MKKTMLACSNAFNQISTLPSALTGLSKWTSSPSTEMMERILL